MTVFDRMKWAVWCRWPAYMPESIRREILELSPFVCNQLGQGSPMVVQRREDFHAGSYDEVPGAPCNIDGVNWIIREWLKANPDWRPSNKP